MRFGESPRKLAALSFLWPALMSLGLLAILASKLGAIGALFSLVPPTNSIVLFACMTLLVALGGGALLLSPVSLSRRSRLMLLFVCVVIALACVDFAQLLLIGWMFPCWYVAKFVRGNADKAAHIIPN